MKTRGTAAVEYQTEEVLRMIEQTGATLRLAADRFAQGASSREALDLTAAAIGEVLGMDSDTFVRMSPPTMVTLLEVSGLDDRLRRQVAESLFLEADILQSEADLVDAAVRREQAAAILAAIDPKRSN